MNATQTFPQAVQTERTDCNEFEPTNRRPVYTGPKFDHTDNRVQLPDGRICFAWEDRTGTEPFAILCTEIAGVDEGGNTIRQRAAEDGRSDGIAAPAAEKTQEFLSTRPAGDIVGYYDCR